MNIRAPGKKHIISVLIVSFTVSAVCSTAFISMKATLSRLERKYMESYITWLELRENAGSLAASPDSFYLQLPAEIKKTVTSGQVFVSGYELAAFTDTIMVKIKKDKTNINLLVVTFCLWCFLSFFTIYSMLFGYFRNSNQGSSVHDLSSKLLATYEGEKKLLAMDIHDDIAQELYTARLLTGDNDEAAKRIELALEKLRNISYQLQPPELELLGFSEAIGELCRNLHTPESMQIKYVCFGLENLNIDYSIKIHIYRIIQEALHNAIKHSSATLVTITLTVKYPVLILQIIDNGIGFDISKIPAGPSKKNFGLQSIQERARLIGGRIRIKSSHLLGTDIEIRTPVDIPV
jgi:signal transduction histidine kinase